MVNQYTSVGGTTRTHDNNGNLADDGTYLYGYDFQNRLVQVTNKGTQQVVATYRYDALGRRVEKAVTGGVTTRYILHGVQVVEEFDGSGVWQARYVYEDGIDRPRCMDRADQADVNGNQNTTEVLRFHYHQQALGGVTELTQPTGAVVEWVTYDVYGLPSARDINGNVVTQSAVGNPYLYTGREYDPESGLYFYRARHYDPVAGRFLQRDPLGYVDGYSLYEYARSGATSRCDPLGQYTWYSPPPKDPGKGATKDQKDAYQEAVRQREVFKAAAATAYSILKWLLGVTTRAGGYSFEGLFRRKLCRHWSMARAIELLDEFFKEPDPAASNGSGGNGPAVVLGGDPRDFKMAYKPKNDLLIAHNAIMKANFWVIVMSIMHEFIHYASLRMGHEGKNTDGTDPGTPADMGDVFEKIAKSEADNQEIKNGRLPAPPPENPEDPTTTHPDSDAEGQIAERLHRLRTR